MTGTESVSIELEARLPSEAADTLASRVPAPLAIELDAAGAAHASVLVLEMQDLGVGERLPPRFDYREVLYRLGVAIGGAPAWLALRCDIDRGLVRTMAASVIRYPVRRAVIEIARSEEGTLGLRAQTDSDRLTATLVLVPSESMPDVTPPRRTFVVSGGALFEVPWDERAAPTRERARLSAMHDDASRSVFGESLAFERSAVIHRGRTHICGSARRIRTFV
jgi:hypothetical protein